MIRLLRRWSVRLLLDPEEAGPLSRVLTPELEAGVDESVLPRQIGSERGDEAESDTVTFDVTAPTASDARIAAQHRLGEMKRRAGLRVREAEVVWVAKLSDDPGADDLRFLRYANELLANEQPEMAVVAAQTHLEIQVRTLLRMTLEAKPSPVFEAISKRLRWAPDNPWLQPILEELYQVRMDRCGAWRAYKAHAVRRNHVVHAGQHVEVIEARESIDAVSRVWTWLSDIANSRVRPG
jgi:hypothetical protein